jgi:multidrug efflux system membrane fusion protein
MRKTYIYSIVIALLIGLWLLSGQLNNEGEIRHATLADQNLENLAEAEDRVPTRVRARISQAQLHTAAVVLRGRTENKRSVTVRSETRGRVTSRPVEKGTAVAVGALLCRLAIEDRNAQILEAREGRNQARIDYQGALRLKQKGFQADSDIARAKARLASAQAAVERGELELSRTYVRAPFAGIIEDTHAEIGDYLQPGAACVTVIDLHPMLLVARISERDIDAVKIAGNASGVLADGSRLEGKISFIGMQSDDSTRTYRLEVQIPNEDNAIRSGLTAQIELPTAQVYAHLISPALMALDTAGNVGIRTLSEDNVVIWNDIEIIDDDDNGAWILGLQDVARIITVGQELVVPGEQVDAVFEQAPSLPAANTPDAPTDQTQRDRLAKQSGQDAV